MDGIFDGVSTVASLCAATALGSFLVIKQICVSHEAARSGIASMLNYHVIDQASGVSAMRRR
ncbi:hypothetical protein [Streptomyces sp. NPDC059455]|uniref:hypothetical protein n=1 Tax=Streptomyces sp. NPDC059455 TaxID=3346837 RepID=UPI003678F42A